MNVEKKTLKGNKIKQKKPNCADHETNQTYKHTRCADANRYEFTEVAAFSICFYVILLL